MKIGVITYSESKDNYGQVLQAYALQRYLKARDHEPFLIRYKANPPGVSGAAAPGNKLLKYALNLPHYCRLYFSRRKKLKAKAAYEAMVDYGRRDFEGFRENFIVQSPLYSPEELRRNPPEADVYICGSDQIWYPYNDDAYFLSFVPEGVPKIAYATSFGGVTEVSNPTRERLVKLLSGFSALGLREESGVEFCNKLGFTDAVRLPDPTLLLDKVAYESLFESSGEEIIPASKYALVYMIGHSSALPFGKIENYVASERLKMAYVATQGRADLDHTLDPTPGEWLALINSADTVITNSFHCIVFCLLFHKNFIAIPMGGSDTRNNDRLTFILSKCGLSDRIAWKSLPQKKLTEADFRQFDSWLETERVSAARFLDLIP